MSFVYRPTPVVRLSGWDPLGEVYYPYGLPIADPKTRWYGYGFKGDTTYPARCGTMQGYTPNMASPRLNAIGRRTLKGDPWLVASGTMGRFLGQDDGSDGSGMDFSGAFASPTLPSSGIVDAGNAPNLFDYGGAFSSPTIPISSASAAGPAPNIGAPALPAASGLIPVSYAGPSAPTAAAGTLAPAAAPAAAAAPSLITSIANLFKSTTSATPMTAAQPGVYKATTVTPSWFSQSSLVSGTPNSTVLIFGVAALVAMAVFVGGKK